MKVFISQSKPRSLLLAQALEPFVRKTVTGTEPWVSDTGIEKGTRFMSEIRDNLGAASAGIVCLTRENLLEPWILYESGALSTKAADRVWTLLLDVEHADVADPLKALNHTKAEKADVLKMVTSIHATVAASGKTCSTEDMKSYFEAFWPELEKVIIDLKAQDPAPPTEPDPQREILDALQTVVANASKDSWRVRKILAMLHVVYRSTVGENAPSLSMLTSLVNEAQAQAGERAIARLVGEDQSGSNQLMAELLKREVIGEPLD